MSAGYYVSRWEMHCAMPDVMPVTCRYELNLQEGSVFLVFLCCSFNIITKLTGFVAILDTLLLLAHGYKRTLRQSDILTIKKAPRPENMAAAPKNATMKP